MLYATTARRPRARLDEAPARGISSGQAIALMEKLARENFPRSMGFEWTELTLQEILAGNTAIFIFPLCVLFVFLTLAAQYESWSLPLAIILMVPMCLFSAISGVWLRAQGRNQELFDAGFDSTWELDFFGHVRRSVQAAAAAARIGVEVADLFPRVTFNGRVAVQAETFSGLGQSGADSWAFGPRITWAALDLGHVRARIHAADARALASLATYEKVVLTSLEETENALVEFGREQSRRDYLRESAQASETAATLAQQRFDNGATDFLTVLDAERVLLEAQDQLAQSQTRTASALVAVYKALGGGWENEAQTLPP